MAHQLKYYKNIESHGHSWRVEFLQDTDETLTPMEIGPVLQGLRLVVQGDQADIDTPIVKTSLEMTFVDAPDLDDSRKCGYWEEFYTSSATEYMVKLYKDGETEWSGFVTPDSFSEDLRYRGSVSIIARDNLGTLQDTTFDMSSQQNLDGKVYLYELIYQAYQISTCVLDYVQPSYMNLAAVNAIDQKYELSGDIMWQMVDVQNLNGMNWWDALEKILYSAGLCLRYVGHNSLSLMHMRDLPKSGAEYWWDVPVKDVQFLAYGHRELIPAVKNIREVNEFDVDVQSEPEQITDYEGRATRTLFNLAFYGPDGQLTSGGTTTNVPAWGYTNPKTKESVTAANSALLNVGAYPKFQGEDSEAYGQWDDKGIIYYAVNANPPIAGEIDNILYPLNFKKTIWSEGATVNVSMVLDKPVTLTSDYSKVLNFPISNVSAYGASPVLRYRLIHTSVSKGTQYYNSSGKKWQSTSVVNQFSPTALTTLFVNDKPQPITFELKDLAMPSYGTLTLEIVNIYIQTLEVTLRQHCAGLFMRLRDVRMDVNIPEDLKLLDKITLTTEYSDKYSVRLTRSPEFAVNPSVLPEVAYIPNAILTQGEYQYSGAEQWVWKHGAEFPNLPEPGISLSRIIHQQLLAYHAAPNNLLTGELLDKGGQFPDFTSLWRWNGKKHMLISGTLNILTGRMENAMLRGFTRYDHMWETWIAENDEDSEVDYGEASVLVTVHSNKEITEADVKNMPEWLSIRTIKARPTGSYIIWFKAAANESNEARQVVMQIDTAYVRVTQRAAGDYNLDYCFDYS